VLTLDPLAWGTMWVEEIYGPDPEMFCLERWLGLSEAKYTEIFTTNRLD